MTLRDDKIYILGIESSCDETAVSILSWVYKNKHKAKPKDLALAGQSKLCSDLVFSQIDQHAAFGGVVPEIAARAHLDIMDQLIKNALQEANISLEEIHAIAVTAGPGLIGGLMVGLMSAKTLALIHNKPLIGVNHLEGHALTPRLTDQISYPYLLLLVSGGHTQILLIKGLGDYERLATTIDDAIGEAFDKSAKLLGLGYPGGPKVEQAAISGDPKRFDLPRPLKGKAELDMSFSGLKTAVRRQVEQLEAVTEQDIADLCASFQLAVSDVICNRISRAMALFEERYNEAHPTIVVAGGVAANKTIRGDLDKLCHAQDKNWRMIAPPLNLCTDNAAMIAWAGLEHYLSKTKFDTNHGLEIEARSRWPLDEQANNLVGHGRRGAKV